MSSLVPRHEYAALSRCTYLNQAALGLIPAPAVEAMHAFVDQTAQFGNLYLTDEQEAAILDGVRAGGAEVLGTTPDAVAVVGSASEGLGQIAALLEPNGGTVVLISTDFPSVTYPWLAAAQRRPITVRFVDDHSDQDLTHGLVNAIDSTTAVVAFSSVQYATGTRVDTEVVARRAHEAGARVVVDVTQQAGAAPVHMTECQADAAVTSGYKWLSAHGGVALLALAPDLADRVPRFVGWKGTEDPFDFDALALRLASTARRFELSTMSYASAVGLETSMAFLSSAGIERIEEHARRLAGRLIASVEESGWRPFRPLRDPAASSHIVSLRHPEHEPGLVGARLASEHGIICGRRGGGVRIALHAFNSEDDVDLLAAALTNGINNA